MFHLNDGDKKKPNPRMAAMESRRSSGLYAHIAAREANERQRLADLNVTSYCSQSQQSRQPSSTTTGPAVPHEASLPLVSSSPYSHLDNWQLEGGAGRESEMTLPNYDDVMKDTKLEEEDDDDAFYTEEELAERRRRMEAEEREKNKRQHQQRKRSLKDKASELVFAAITGNVPAERAPTF